LFACSQATPIRRADDKAKATLKKLDGSVEFTQDSANINASLLFNEGFDSNDTTIYFVQIGQTGQTGQIGPASFASLGIPITPPKAGPFNGALPANISLIIGQPLIILKNTDTLDSATIEKE
ncbi:6868_t:CDS:1, partial [Scutellospora calospora]